MIVRAREFDVSFADDIHVCTTLGLPCVRPRVPHRKFPELQVEPGTPARSRVRRNLDGQECPSYKRAIPFLTALESRATTML